MNNPIIEALYAHIASEVPAIRYVAQDLLQLDIYETRPAVSFPCVLIDLNTTYETRQAHLQWGTVTIKLKLGFAQFSNDSSISPQAVQDAGRQYYQLEDQLVRALQEWNGGGIFTIKPIRRTAATTQPRPDAYRVRVITLTATFEESFS